MVKDNNSTVIKLPVFDEIQQREIIAIRKYSYKYLDAYIKSQKHTRHFQHLKSNVIGEMYEYLIYEKLLKWAEETSGVVDFVLKGPYVKRDVTKKEGFVYDPNNQIYYMSSGETIGEFDAMFSFGKYRYYVEISRSKVNVDILKAGIIRKYNLLKILFPREEISCWIISPAIKTIVVPGISRITVLNTPAYELNPVSLRQKAEDISFRPIEGKQSTVYELRNKEFEYYKVLSRLHNQLKKTQPHELRQKAIRLLRPYTGLIERIYLGKISPDVYNRFITSIGYDTRVVNQISLAYLALRISDELTVSIDFFLKTDSGKYFKAAETQNFKPSEIDRRKRAPREIRRFERRMPQLDEQKVKEYYAALSQQ